VGVGGAVYALALVATLPARVVLPRAVDTAGTVWHGEAALGGSHVAAWHASLLDSLAAAGVAGRWTIDGPGSALQGGARWRPFAGVVLDSVRGRAGWPLVALAAPALPFTCDAGVHVTLDRVVLAAKRQSVAGSITSDPGSCTTRTPGATKVVPRLVADFAGGERTTGVVSPWANRALHLADLTLENGVVRLHTSAAGAALIPGSTGPGDLEIEL
jgi:hypothetical protein